MPELRVRRGVLVVCLGESEKVGEAKKKTVVLQQNGHEDVCGIASVSLVAFHRCPCKKHFEQQYHNK